MTESAVKWCAVCAVFVTLIGFLAASRGCEIYNASIKDIAVACVQAGGSFVREQCISKNHEHK